MFLKRIELNGFKSFPGKKEIIVNEGITGVVGPNGSGKSNIADALRWVLGEQSSKNLRGTSMQDVIFNGTQSRSPKGFCEVSLVFDNEDRRIDSDYSEIAIRRKMYRSGESEFSINGGSCRLKDILELFRDTGIGKEGYSIIGQGRIDEILNSKAVQRRRVFEEAAGIMKYRVRKEEAERNLQKTHDNITRMDDIIAELETQVGPLEEQMQQAKGYYTLRDRLKELDVNLYLYNLERSAERMIKTDQQIGEQEQESEDITKEIEALGIAQSTVKRRLNELQQEIEAHNTQTGELVRSQEQLKGEDALIAERERNCRATIVENTTKIGESLDAVEARQAEIEEINGRIEVLNGQLDKQYAKIVAFREDMQRISGTETDYETEIDRLKQGVENARTALQTCKIDYSENQVKSGLLDEKLMGLEARADAIQGEALELERRLNEQQAAFGELESQSAQHRQKVNEATQNLRQLVEKRQQLEERVREATKLLNEDTSRLRLLADMQEEHEGYFNSVRNLLKAADGRPELKSRITGVLAEVIDVPREYELPIEIILGNSLQNIVVQSDRDAKEIISYLREKDMGRVTFLPAKDLKIKYLRDEERKLLNSNGVRGIASEMISCGEGIRPAVDFLLSRTVIVEDLDIATELMRKADYGFRVVTMQGDFINPGGAITGGSTRRTGTGLLSRKRMAEELERRVEKHKESLAGLSSETEELEKQNRVLQEEQQSALDMLKKNEISVAEEKQVLISLRNQCMEKQNIYEACTAEKQQATAEKEQRTEQAKQSDSLITEAQKQFDEWTAQLETAEKQRADSLRVSVQKREELSALEIGHSELNNQKSVLLNEAEHLRASVQSLQDGIKSMQEQNDAMKRELDSIEARKQEVSELLSTMFQKVEDAGVSINEKLKEREQLNVQIVGNEEKSAQLNERKTLLIEQKYRMIANKEKMELARETAQNKIWDDYGLTYANAQELKLENFAYQASVREADEIKEQLREMGAVNPNAIEDYARVSERYNNLVTQREDLLKASDDLQVVIADLMTGMRSSFKEKFELINNGFVRVFQELFGGGHAQLELLDKEDIMECGIDIIAEPPGKKLQNISLLSGGEKALTAIALLFAMLSINPSPVCLLDEIDAPLDDANLIRLSDYLTRLSRELQFIVITHRKPTMAICDTLYGIAMHEKGVSDIVSVQLDS